MRFRNVYLFYSNLSFSFVLTYVGGWLEGLSTYIVLWKGECSFTTIFQSIFHCILQVWHVQRVCHSCCSSCVGGSKLDLWSRDNCYLAETASRPGIIIIQRYLFPGKGQFGTIKPLDSYSNFVIHSFYHWVNNVFGKVSCTRPFGRGGWLLLVGQTLQLWFAVG